MSAPAQGPVTIYPPQPISVAGFAPSPRRPKFQSKLKTLLSILVVSGVVSGFYPLVSEVRGVLTQGGSAVTLDKVLDENFNLSLAGNLEGSQLISTTNDSDPLVVNSTSLVDNLNADLLDGQHGSYYIDTFPATGWTDDGTKVRLTTSTDLAGIGTTSPEETLHVFRSNTTGTDSLVKSGLFDLFLYADDATPGTNLYMGVQGRTRYYGVSGETAYSVAGVRGSFLNMSSGDVTEAVGVYATAGNNSTGTIDRAIGFYSPAVANLSTGTINEAYGLLVGSVINSGGGTITDNYGVYIGNQTCASCTTSWALYSQAGNNYFGGEVGFGTDDLAGVGVATIDGLVRMRNATDSRYRSDWVVNTDGLSVNSFDDTGAVSLPIRFDGFSFAMRADGDDTKSITLDNSGAVGIGTVSPDQRLEVETAVEGDVMRLNDGTETCDLDPDAGGVIETCSSDIRLKTNISDASSVLDYLADLPLKEFDMISSGEHSLGVIAQELLALPEYADLVTQGADGYYRVKSISPWEIIKGIQELSQKVQNLQLAIDSSGDAAQANTDGSTTKIVAETVKAGEGIFESIIAKTVEIASAAVENLRVKFLTIGESSAPTGITIYDRANGEPYCVTVNEGTVVTTPGVCE